MLYLTCGKYTIPLIYVRSIAWNRRARTVERTGGYLLSRGFETTEVTVQGSFDEGLCAVLGRSLPEEVTTFDSLVTDRMDTPDTLYIGGYPVVPSLQFALTSCNMTRVDDPVYSCALSFDLVFAGVRVSKESSRQRAMQFESDEVWDIPAVTLSVGDKSLKLRDMYQLSELKRTPDSISLVCYIADDMAVADDTGYLSKLVEDKATLEVDFPDGKVKYWVISASLDDNTLSLIGSSLPEEALKPYPKTYWDTTMSAILKDLCGAMGVSCACKFIDFPVEYFQTVDAPMDSIRSLVNSGGLLLMWDKNDITFVDVPSFVAAKYELEATTTPSDEGLSLYTACVWSDGLHRITTGDTSGETVYYSSVFRSESKTPCENCLKLARFYQRTAVVQSPLARGIVHGSAVRVNTNGSMADGIVTEYDTDYISERGRYEVGIIG